ncbi:MAG: putative metal-binding motif-containing protein [Candidatus Uhrbacteria bacterium]
MPLALFALLALQGCYFIGNPDGDTLSGLADCDPNSDVACDKVDTDADTDTDADADADSDADTDTDINVETGDTGETGDTDTGVPCETSTWHPDSDGDGYGDPATSAEACDQPDGYVADGTDCDDASADTYPGAAERCDLQDNNCDGLADENLSESWYSDSDNDGFGDESTNVDVTCDGTTGDLVAARDSDGDGTADFDCDDSNATVNPLAEEVCDEADNDCDGSIDESGAFGETTWYADVDGDGYGAGAMVAEACDGAYTRPANASSVDTDCDDASSATNPGATEICDGADNDCDGAVPSDESDLDGDGFNVCAGLDCDDASASSYPGAPESCDGADNDCDGAVDESDASDVTTWYVDVDGDGYGDASTGFVSCDAPIGYVADATDCDDSEASVNPGEHEICNGIDDDCDGDVDVAAEDATVWSTDLDGDGYGDDTYASWLASCDQPDGYVADFSDCDDSDAAVSPDATEIYANLVDDDCNGIVDDSGLTCFPDADNDTYGAPTGGIYEPTGVCGTAGYVPRDSDCDDTNATTNPSRAEVYGDGVDNDCDGSAT